MGHFDSFTVKKFDRLVVIIAVGSLAGAAAIIGTVALIW